MDVLAQIRERAGKGLKPVKADDGGEGEGKKGGGAEGSGKPAPPPSTGNPLMDAILNKRLKPTKPKGAGEKPKDAEEDKEEKSKRDSITFGAAGMIARLTARRRMIAGREPGSAASEIPRLPRRSTALPVLSRGPRRPAPMEGVKEEDGEEEEEGEGEAQPPAPALLSRRRSSASGMSEVSESGTSSSSSSSASSPEGGKAGEGEAARGGGAGTADTQSVAAAAPPAPRVAQSVPPALERALSRRNTGMFGLVEHNRAMVAVTASVITRDDSESDDEGWD